MQLALPKLLEHGRATADAIWARVLRNERTLFRPRSPRAAPSPSCPSGPGGRRASACRPSRPEEELVLDLLEAHDLLVQPGYFYEFPFEAFLVVSLLPPPDVFRDAVDRLVRALRAA